MAVRTERHHLGAVPVAADGRIVRGRPRGSWTSSQYHWSPVQDWLPGGFGSLPADEARVRLVRDWLVAYGPGTVADLKWWTGWTLGQVRQALGSIDPVEVDLDGVTGLCCAGADPVPPRSLGRTVAGVDPTPMGWTAAPGTSASTAAAVDRSGNGGPTVGATAGRGGWAQRGTARCLSAAGGRRCRASTLIAAQAAEVSAWTGR